MARLTVSLSLGMSLQSTDSTKTSELALLRSLTGSIGSLILPVGVDLVREPFGVVGLV